MTLIHILQNGMLFKSKNKKSRYFMQVQPRLFSLLGETHINNEFSNEEKTSKVDSPGGGIQHAVHSTTLQVNRNTIVNLKVCIFCLNFSISRCLSNHCSIWSCTGESTSCSSYNWGKCTSRIHFGDG